MSGGAGDDPGLDSAVGRPSVAMAPPRWGRRSPGIREGEREAVNGSDRGGPTYAALDLGTNNCRLLVARPNGDSFRVIDAFSRIVRLGEGISASGRLSEAAIGRSLEALEICRNKMRNRGVTRARLNTEGSTVEAAFDFTPADDAGRDSAGAVISLRSGFAMRIAAALVAVLAFGWLGLSGGASAQSRDLRFPALTGRVVDQANLLSPAKEAELTARLEALERDTSDQLVVVTLPDLQGREIEDYGYRLGRAWGIGQSGTNNGVLLIVAARERKVRIEVGYGLEPVLTDGLSALIIHNEILPAFREGYFEQGVERGVAAIETQLRLDPAEAEARAAAADNPTAEVPVGSLVMIGAVFLLFFASMMGAVAGRGRRRGGGSGVAPILLWAASEALRNSGRGGGGSSWGGGGFGGGGGSFGGGGASGGW